MRRFELVVPEYEEWERPQRWEQWAPLALVVGWLVVMALAALGAIA